MGLSAPIGTTMDPRAPYKAPDSSSAEQGEIVQAPTAPEPKPEPPKEASTTEPKEIVKPEPVQEATKEEPAKEVAKTEPAQETKAIRSQNRRSRTTGGASPGRSAWSSAPAAVA
jgi:hypothetical protein